MTASPTLRAYVECHPNFGRGIHRVVRALKRHVPPGVEIVEARDAADLIVHHVIGVGNFADTPLDELIAEDAGAGRHHAMIQYCLRTTEQPTTTWWADLWRTASAVWSYYDLPAAMAADHGLRQDQLDFSVFPFLRLPLGVDSSVFHPFERPLAPHYGLVTSGHVASTECIAECAEACLKAGVRMAHLGPPLAEILTLSNVDFFQGLSDAELAILYRNARYVAGLRRVEGFELPAAEGLLCGTRPICLAEEHYSHWFEDAALYVRDDATLVDQLAGILSSRPRPVGGIEHGLVQRTFSWPRVVGQFWRQVIEGS